MFYLPLQYWLTGPVGEWGWLLVFLPIESACVLPTESACVLPTEPVAIFVRRAH